MAILASNAPVCRSDIVRLGACAAVVVSVHAAIAVALLSRWDTADIEPGAPVVMLELAPVAAAPPAPSTELPPGLQQTEAEAQAQMRQESETRQPVEPHEKDEIPIEHPEVSLPPPTHDPTRESTEAKVEQQATEATPAATAPPSVEMLASRPEGPPMGEVSKTPSAAEITWQRSMLSRVQRFHRYPARAHNESGVAQVEFAIDRAGRVLSSRITKSSGHAVLDQDALALIRRASPFPSPPPSVSDELLTVIIPVRYDAAR